MANGDKPPGGVSASIASPNITQSISINCNEVADADALATEIIEEVEKIRIEYQKQGKLHD